MRGKLEEVSSKELIIGASVYVPALKQGTTTNAYGAFTLWLPAGVHDIDFSSVGFETKRITLNINGDTVITESLAQKSSTLQEVVIQGEEDRVNSLRLGMNSLNVATLKKIPPLLGEPDIIKGLLLMPGVTSVGEGATGYNVRGGSVDQNLVLLDDAPIFNSSHLFGFLTAFNSNAVQSADLFKGGIPANYGGRSASVLDVKLKQGNASKLSANVGVSLMSGHATLEGPITQDRTTFLLSGRSSYSDWLLRTVPQDAINKSRASFYDATLKLTHRINANHTLSFTAYRSNDQFKFEEDTTYHWVTTNFSAKLGSTLTKNLFLVTSLISSNYAYDVEGNQLTNEFRWKAGIRYRAAKADATLSHSLKHKSDFGMGIENYQVALGSLEPLNNSNVNSFALADENAWIGFAYVSHQADLSERLSLRFGIRGSLYQLFGPGTLNEYTEGIPRSRETFVGSTTFARGESIQQYFAWEPRLSAKMNLSPNSSIKLGVDRAVQFIHLVSNTSAVSPVDVWKLSDPYLKPQVSSQGSIGYFVRTPGGKYNFSAEAFVKRMENVVDYKNGAAIVLNDKLEADLLQGDGRSYGLELMVEKNIGRLTGWLSYTLSRTERRIAGPSKAETINMGQYYPADFDKPHNIAYTGSYQANKRTFIGFNFIFNSGRPITYPSSSYLYNNVRIVNFEFRNNERTPSYHRVDFSLTVKSHERAGRNWKGSWTFSIYNVYARKNPYSIFFRNEFNKNAQSYRLAVLGTAIPSLSYNITF